MATIMLRIDGPVARVTLARPDVRNAFNEALIADLTSAFDDIARRDDLRAVLIDGEGKTFCAGADLEWMSRASRYSDEENRGDAMRMNRMFTAVDECPVPVMARVQGAALGGGCGLIACADIVVAADTAVFGLTEVKVGIIPAVISPFVLSKIGQGHARALYLSGERFPAARAQAVGLVHVVVPETGLDAAVRKVCENILSSGPRAVREAKVFIRQVAPLSKRDAASLAPDKIAALRASPEGREGISAFLEKRNPQWVVPAPPFPIS